MTTRLDISVGPVQGFVAQSRRTRDLWGSSYLLSFLTAHAMRGAHDAGGTVVSPVVDRDPLYQWVTDHRDGDPPRIGSVPNHFVVEVGGGAYHVAYAAQQALADAWTRVCEAVWRRFVEHARDLGDGTDQIWKRQVGSFWELQWTAGPATQGGLLARRKHWRGHRPPDEPGDKCSVMHDLQELSGHVRAQHSEKDKQDAFWGRVRTRVGPLDLRPNERLCAVALVKRLFAKTASDALGWNVDIAHWPSTVHIGAVPWLRRAAAAEPSRASQYADAVKRYAPDGALSALQTPFQGLDLPQAGDFPKLDANYYHQGFVQDPRLCPLRDDAPPHAREELRERLRMVYDAADDRRARMGAPPTFYALLLADGDRLGKLVSSLGSDTVGRALADFTGAVPGVVSARDGVTIYAGGDDVLAMLPVPGALACARDLARRYADAFAKTGAPSDATLSAAVAFAHVRLPLGGVITEAHRLLDDLAKDANGRDSLAAAVLKGGGLQCEWVTTWQRATAGAEPADAVDLIRQLAEHLRRGVPEPGLSAALLYRIRELLGLLCGWPRWVPGAWGALPPDLDVPTFLRAEVLRTLGAAGDGEDRADDLCDLLGKLLQPARATPADDGAEPAQAGVDALLLARFLAGGGHEQDTM